ncbi:MAG: HAD family hydrolase [Patescibacteria group bacterium]|nr:HAD family hydrolase [Patescibacteria group bacterium]
MKYKAVLFDVDDTLCKTAGTKGYVFDQLYRNHKIFHSVPIEKFRKILTESREKYFNKLISKGFNTYARIEFWFEIMKNLKIVVPVVELSEIVTEYWELTYEHVVPYPGLQEMLEELRKLDGIIIATLTAGDYYSKTEKLMKLGIEKYFDYNFVTELVQKPKTTGHIYQYVLDYLNLEPKEVLMVGDKPHEDIIPANKIGIDTVQVTIRGDFEVAAKGHAKPDFVTDNLKELIQIINN